MPWKGWRAGLFRGRLSRAAGHTAVSLVPLFTDPSGTGTYLLSLENTIPFRRGGSCKSRWQRFCAMDFSTVHLFAPPAAEDARFYGEKSDGDCRSIASLILPRRAGARGAKVEYCCIYKRFKWKAFVFSSPALRWMSNVTFYLATSVSCGTKSVKLAPKPRDFLCFQAFCETSLAMQSALKMLS